MEGEHENDLYRLLVIISCGHQVLMWEKTNQICHCQLEHLNHKFVFTLVNNDVLQSTCSDGNVALPHKSRQSEYDNPLDLVYTDI